MSDSVWPHRWQPTRRNARLDKLQAGINIVGRNIINLIYVKDTILMAVREEELKSLWMRVKEETERASLRLNIKKPKIIASSPIQFSSVAQSCLSLWDPMEYSMPGFPVHHQLMELAQTHVHQVGDAIQHPILYHLLLLLPSIFPSIRVFSSESVLCIRWPNYWSFTVTISPPNEYSGLVSFRIDWFNLLAPIRKPLRRHAWYLLTGQHIFFPTD